MIHELVFIINQHDQLAHKYINVMGQSNEPFHRQDLLYNNKELIRRFVPNPP